VGLLAGHLLERGRVRNGAPARRFSVDALSVLAAYPLPGNVRELKNIVDYALALCDGEVVEPSHLPPYLETQAPAPAQVSATATPGPALLDDLVFRVARDQFERRYMTELMRVSGGNLSEAARRSGVDRSNLRRMLRRLGLAGSEGGGGGGSDGDGDGDGGAG
jgi:DNA-binding NtrC family response regulator